MPDPLRSSAVCVLMGMVALVGCRSKPYVYGRFEHDPATTPKHVLVEVGEPRKHLDRAARVLSFPRRLLSRKDKRDPHQVSPETIGQVVNYMEANDLRDVRVFVKHYDPRGQWRLLRENDAMRPGFRYTFGTLNWVGYTLVPGRVFGTNKYNPFTNSLHINSDLPAVALKEAAYAKDVHWRVYPGSYVMVSSLPGFALARSIRHAQDVFDYARTNRDWNLERDAYHALYPAIGAEATSLGAPLVNPALWWAGPALGATGAAAGHVTGRTLASRREQELLESAPAAPNPPATISAPTTPAQPPITELLPKPPQ